MKFIDWLLKNKKNFSDQDEVNRNKKRAQASVAGEAQEYINEYDQEASPPNENGESVTSSSPGNSLHRKKHYHS
jgi:hypothetical protein